MLKLAESIPGTPIIQDLREAFQKSLGELITDYKSLAKEHDFDTWFSAQHILVQELYSAFENEQSLLRESQQKSGSDYAEE